MQNKEIELHKYNGFKLISLRLVGNSLIGNGDITYEFVELNDKQNSIYTTVIIGPNGTGKSNLFRIIIHLFKELHDLKNGGNRNYEVKGLFHLKYSLNGDIYEYTNIIYWDGTFKADGHPELDNQNPDKSNRAYLKVNNKVVAFSNAEFPLSIVANSIMLTDKFPFYNKIKLNDGDYVDAFPVYKYLGVKHIAQAASTQAYIRRTVEFIVDIFNRSNTNRKGFLNSLKRATDFLELDNYLDIYYTTSNNSKFFKGNLVPQKLEEYFEDIRERYSKLSIKAPFKLDHYSKIKNEEKLLKEICNYCNGLVGDDRLNTIPGRENSSIRMINYNLLEPSSAKALGNEYRLLEHLRQLGLIMSPEMRFKRANSTYSIQESSSGEYHFFSSIIGLIATVRPTNSLVLIDEPEASLHPNWQMKYLEFLRELFIHEEYSTGHILVATHSHFVVSDLKGENSKIVGLKRNKGIVELVPLPKNLDTFGWSADDVLYNIFNVVSSRNKFVAETIADILDDLSKGKEGIKNSLQEGTYDTLIYLQKSLKDNDPLKHVVNSIMKKIQL